MGKILPTFIGVVVVCFLCVCVRNALMLRRGATECFGDLILTRQSLTLLTVSSHYYIYVCHKHT